MTGKEIQELRNKGLTYREIGEMCGISKQSVRQKLATYLINGGEESRGRHFNINCIIYQGIYDHFKECKTETLPSFTKKVFKDKYYPALMKKLRHFVSGKSESYFTVEQIRGICEATGKSFEETFVKRNAD